MTMGVFVPFPYGRRYTKLSRKVGWITDENGCDIWQGSRNQGGYGRVRVGGQVHSAHRLRYEREVGPIPEGMVLDHVVCDNGGGGCCNPHHCHPTTREDNSRRGVTKWRRENPFPPKTHCINGHALTDDNIEPYSLRYGLRRCLVCRKGQGRRATAKYLQRKKQREGKQRVNH